MIDQIKIGNYIQNLRKSNGLTQKELADKLGLTFQAVSKWELGETLPDTAILLELSEILNTNVDLLLHGGSYLIGNRKLLHISDILEGLEAIKRMKDKLGENSYFYLGTIEGINKKMNMDIEEHLKYHMEVLVAEVILQGIQLGNCYVDMAEVRSYIKNEKLVNYIDKELKKIMI